MTILNAWIVRDEVIVATDTVCQLHDGSRGLASKVHSIVHLNALLAGRGHSGFINFLTMLCLQARAETIDELLSAMPELLIQAEAVVPPDFTIGGEPGYEILIAGWSDRRSRMIMHAFMHRDGKRYDVAVDHVVSPWDSSMPEIPKHHSKLEHIFKAQVRWLTADAGPAAGGGTLVVCRLTKTGMSIKHQLKFTAEEVTA